MGALIQFLLPVKGLQHGVYDYNFHIDKAFFQSFERSPLQDGDVQVQLQFEKQPGMFILDLRIKGTVATDCDRCLAPIQLPIEDERSFVVKFSTEEEVDDDDVVYLHPDTQQFDLAPYIYEFVILAIPMVKTYACDQEPVPPCDQALLKHFLRQEDIPDEDIPADDNKADASNPLWDVLKQINFDNNNN
jgi:uncharacterized metal-binding protein YceD (DUF177 family)